MAKAATGPRQTEAVPLEVRNERGSRKAQVLRAQGKIPGILYGMGKEPVAVSMPHVPALAVLRSGSHIMKIKLDGKEDTVLIKAVQYDFLQTTLEHLDLLRIDPNQTVRVKVPLEFRGTPAGAKDGGILETQLKELELEVKALEIPDLIRVTVDHLELHQILHAKDVKIPEGSRLINHPEAIVCQVRTVKEEEVAVAAVEAGPAEPEVIGKKKEEEGAEGAEGAAPAGGKPAAGAKAAPAAPAKK